MKPFPILLLFLLVSVIGNTQNQIQKNWINAFNSGEKEKIKEFYLPQAGIFMKGNLEKVGNSGYEALEILRKEVKEFDNYEPAFSTEARPGNVMTLGYLKSGENLYAVLIAWRKQGDAFLKEFETISRIGSQSIHFQSEKMTLQRRNWEKYSNAHDPKGLLENVYTEDAYYFSQGRINSGRSDITERYGYMKNPNWKIRLEEKGLIPVDESRVLEIGKYYSTGEGQYLLIWEKTQNDKWQIKLDFNF